MASIDPKAFDGIPLEIVALPLKGPGGKQGDPGKTGAPGKSNYQLWLEAGNTGSIEDFLLTTKGEKGDTGAGLINRGRWTIATYKPGEFVSAPKSNTDTSMVVWVLVGNEEYLSTLPPANDLSMWSMLDIKAGFDDAPSDGKQYARKNGGWVEVVSAGDVERVLSMTTTVDVDPWAEYTKWETEYGFVAGSSAWAGLNADDSAFLLFAGRPQGMSPAMSFSSEGQFGYDYAATPTGASAVINPPNVSRAYWMANPHPQKYLSFHPVGTDAESRQCIGHPTKDGLIMRGAIGARSTPNECRFAARFINGSWEIFLKTVNLPTDLRFFQVGGGEATPSFTLIGDAGVMPLNGYLQASYKPAE